jgi:hypothetical protein
MQVHLISFNIPYPADYGGVIDVFYKIKALSALGVNIHLHCFAYGRKPAVQLLQHCSQVSYYPRDLNFGKHLSLIPYIVSSRNSKLLNKCILADRNPIIFEGLHCTYPLYAKHLENRITLVRTHNVEHEYYKGLALSESNVIRKVYFQIEAIKLKRYEPVLGKATAIAAISAMERDYFSRYCSNTMLITPFHPFSEVNIKPGRGKYILVHGDLSVAENIHSVEWIIANIVPSCPYPFIVAGKNPAPVMLEMAKKQSRIKIIANPDEKTMAQLVEDAHINLIHSFFPQGFKLKLLHALYKGRFIICNPSVVSGTGLEAHCHTADGAEQFIEEIAKFMNIDFDREQVRQRSESLEPFSNAVQAKRLIEIIGC